MHVCKSIVVVFAITFYVFDKVTYDCILNWSSIDWKHTHTHKETHTSITRLNCQFMQSYLQHLYRKLCRLKFLWKEKCVYFRCEMCIYIENVNKFGFSSACRNHRCRLHDSFHFNWYICNIVSQRIASPSQSSFFFPAIFGIEH